jgi:hypothetical protein
VRHSRMHHQIVEVQPVRPLLAARAGPRVHLARQAEVTEASGIGSAGPAGRHPRVLRPLLAGRLGPGKGGPVPNRQSMRDRSPPTGGLSDASRDRTGHARGRMPLLRTRGPGLRGPTAVPTLRVPTGRGSDAAAHVAGGALLGGWGRSLGQREGLADNSTGLLASAGYAAPRTTTDRPPFN